MPKHIQTDLFQIKQNKSIVSSTTPKIPCASSQRGALTRGETGTGLIVVYNVYIM